MRYIPMLEGFDADAGLTLEDVADLAFGGRARLRRASVEDRPRRRGPSWAYAVRARDHDRLEPLLRPLARLRSPTGAVAPVVVPDEVDFGDNRQRAEWVDRFANDDRRFPDNLLLAGGPDRFPFLLQAELAIITRVGRVAFDDDGDLTAYVDKLCRWERDGRPPQRRAVFFATSAPNDPGDATNFSRWMLAAPLADRSEDVITVERLFDERATIQQLVEALSRPGVGVAFTATHGRVRPALAAGLERQRRENGAIVDGARPQRQLAGDGLPDEDVALCEGGVIFQFACCGYGTPRTSRFAHWWPDDRIAVSAREDFVAALPQRLLAHRRGPAAFIGHIDVAWALSFADEGELRAGAVTDHHRLRPFRDCIRALLGGVPVGAAMAGFTGVYNLANQRLTAQRDEVEREHRALTESEQVTLVSWFMLRNDIENYFLFGDPSAAVAQA